jgi:hypothetical protein
MNYHNHHRNFEAEAMLALSRFRPRLKPRGHYGLPVTAVSLGFGTSASGLPIRRYRDPRNGSVLVFGADLALYRRTGRIHLVQLGGR